MSLSKHRCEVCDLSFTSYQHYSIHLGGLLHNEKEKRKLEAEGNLVQGFSRITNSAEYPLSASNRYTGTNVGSVSTRLHSCLKQPKSSTTSVPCDASLTSSSQSYHSSVTVASRPTDSLYSSHLSSYSGFASPNNSSYKDNWQLDKKDANGGGESYRSQGLPRREEQNSLHANNRTEALARTPSSVTRSSKEKASILSLLAAQRLLQDNPLREMSPKQPAKVEVKSKDSVRNLLSAQFDLLKSYMTEPPKPASASEPERVKASSRQDLSRLKAADWSDASLSTTARSTHVVRNRHALEAADQYSADRSVGQRSQGLVKTPSDFWSRQATYADEVQSDLSSIPFLGEGYAKDEGMVEEQQASFRPHSRDQVAASTWDRNDGSFSAGQWDRSSDHAVKTTHADVSKASGPTRSDVPNSDRTWQSHGYDKVKSSVPSDAWELRENDGLERTVERTYNNEQRYEPNEDYYASQLNNPLFSSENSRIHPAAGAYQQQKPSFRDDFRRPVPPLIETNRSQSSMQEFMAQVKKNLQRDLSYDSFPANTSSSEVNADFGRSYPVAAPLRPQLTQRKVLLNTPSASTSFGTSVNVSTASAVASKKILLPTPTAGPATAQSSTTFSSTGKILLPTPTADPAMAQSSATSSSTGKILLPTPTADPVTVQSFTRSLPSSSTGTSWSQPDGRAGIPSQQQQPRFSSLTHGGGRFIGSDGSTTVRPPTKKTLLSTPPASCLQPGFYGNSSSSAGVVSSAKEFPLQAALSAKSSPLSRNLGADKNLMTAASSKPLLPLPVKSSLKTNVAAAKPQPSIGKLQAVSTEKNEMEEVDPQLKLQKEIEVVMAERVEDLMRAIPESMMRSIMDGKVPLEFLDKISDLIPTDVIEEAVRQKEQLAADKCISAGSGHLKTGTNRTPWVGPQVVAKPGQVSGDGAESRSKVGAHDLERTAATEVAMGLNMGGKVELVKKMIDEILGDLAIETGAPSNTDILEKLAPDDRSMVLEMQDVAGIRDVSVTIEILEFFKTLDRNLLLALSTIDESEKEGEGESVLKRMTKLMLNNYSKNDPSARVVCKNAPTLKSQTVATTHAGLRNSIQPCIANSSTAVGAQQNKVVAAKKPELQPVSFTAKSNVNVSKTETVKGSPCTAQNKTENPKIKAPVISLSETPPCRPTGVVEKPGVKGPSVLPQKRDGVSETFGVKTVPNVPQTVTASANKPGIKATFNLHQNINIGSEKTPPCAPQIKPGSAELSVSNASRTSVNSVATPVKSELQGISCNPQKEAVAAQMSETKTVTSNLQNPVKRNEPSTVIGATVSVEKNPSVGVTADSKASTLSQSQKAAIAVAGKTELKGTSEGYSMNSSGILKTPDVKSSSDVEEKITNSDKLGMRSSSDAALGKTETVETPELKSPGSNTQNNISNEESRSTVTPDVQQAKAAATASTDTEAVAAADMGAVTSSVVAKQSESSSTDKRDSDKPSEMGTKSGQSVCSLDVTLTPCAADIQPAEEMSSEKAEKRKAAEPLEPNKKAKLEATSAVVSEEPAVTSTTSTATETQPKTSCVASGSSTTGGGPRCLLASPIQRPLLQSPKLKTVLLPTPVRAPVWPPPRTVPLLSPRPDMWNKQPSSQAPFPPQRPRLPGAVMPQRPRGSFEQRGAPSFPHVRQLMSDHRMPRPPPHELMADHRMPRPPAHNLMADHRMPRPPAHELMADHRMPRPPAHNLMADHRMPRPHEMMADNRMPRPPHGLLHPPDARLNLMPQMRAQPPPMQPPMVRSWPPDEPFRSRNPMNMRPCLPNPSLNQLPRQPLLHAGNSFRFPGPNSDNCGPPPFKRWR